jgi:outer membrane protein OmpA-like peptidoglycan-associated protein
MLERRSEYRLVRLSVDHVSIVADGGTPCNCMEKVRDSLYAIRARHPKDPDIPRVVPAMVKDIASRPDTIRLSNVLFEFGRSELRDSAFLEKYRMVLSDSTVKRLVIAGYADDAGSVEYNLQLSSDRARTVSGAIIKMFGLPASMIEASGKGISTEFADKSLNRRVEILIYH